MATLPPWGQLVLTYGGGFLSGILGSIFTFGRHIRRVERAVFAKIDAVSGEEREERIALERRMAKIEGEIGVDGGGSGFHGMLARLEELIEQNGKAEHRHYNRTTAALIRIGATVSGPDGARLDFSDLFAGSHND